MKKNVFIVFILLFSYLSCQTIFLGPEDGYRSYLDSKLGLRIGYDLESDNFYFFVSTDETYYSFTLESIDIFKECLKKFVTWNLKADSLKVILEKDICTIDESSLVSFYYGDWHIAESGKPVLKFRSVEVGRHDLLIWFPPMQDWENEYIDTKGGFLTLNFPTVKEILNDISDEKIKNLKKKKDEQKNIEKLFE